MNERIRELAKEALDYAEKNQSAEVPQHWFKLYNEKFAELIVRECCQYLNSEAERLYALSISEHRSDFKEDFEICAEKCYDNIQGLKEHFGVEE